MWQQKSSFEQSNVLDVTIQCRFDVATKNVMEFSTMYPHQTTSTTVPDNRVQRPFLATPGAQMSSNNYTPTKPMYQCEFEAQQRYPCDSVFTSGFGGSPYDYVPSKNGYLNVSANSVGLNTSGSGFYFSCMNDSGYGSPSVPSAHDSTSGLYQCSDQSRLSSGSPVLKSSVNSDMFGECKNNVSNSHVSNSHVTASHVQDNSDEDTCEMKIALREKNVMQRLFSLRSVNGKASSDIEQYYQAQTTAIDLERHNVLCQMAYSKQSVDSVNKYYNSKLLCLLECVEEKLSASESKKCKGTKCKASADRKSRLLPKHAVKLMQNWYDENLENPYPSREATLTMASEGDVTVEQIRKWFANKRNRSRNSKLKASDIDADEL